VDYVQKLCYIIRNRNERYDIPCVRDDFLSYFIIDQKIKRSGIMPEMVRVNTRISSVLNDWLDEQYEKTGIPKSTQVMLALENYRKEKLVIDNMGDFQAILDKLEKLSTEQ
jgi:hypothetical protein